MKQLFWFFVISTALTWAAIYFAAFHFTPNKHVQNVEDKIERLQGSIEAMDATLTAIEDKCIKKIGVKP